MMGQLQSLPHRQESPTFFRYRYRHVIPALQLHQENLKRPLQILMWMLIKYGPEMPN